MKKLLLLTLSALVVAMAMAATYPASYYTIASETATVAGDVNGDGQVTATDITLLYNVILSNNHSGVVNGDQNGDGDITAGDVTLVYNVMLGGGGSSAQVTKIKMNDYISVTSSATPVQHTWKNNEDVIFIALDGVEENMYVLVRSGGKWLLKDINGSNKAGFKTSGSIKAAWVRNADYANAQVWNIDVPVDLATGSGTYTRSGTTVAINLNLTLMESKLEVIRPSQGDYVTYYDHVAGITSITENDYYKEPKAPVAHFVTSGNTTFGYAYGIMQSYDYYHYLSQGKTGYKSEMTYPLTPGKTHFIYSPDAYWSIWTRDFSMIYYHAFDNITRITLNNTGSVVYMPVGASINFIPQEAGVTVWDGILQSFSSSNTTSVKCYEYNTAHTITIEAMEVGTSTVSFRYTSPGGGTYNYQFTVKVEPSIWVAGSQLNASGVKVPAIYYNNKGTSHPSISGATGDQWVERFEVGNGNGFAWVTNGSKSEIHRSTNPYAYGSFIKRYDVKSATPWLYADKSGNVYYLTNYSSGNYMIFKNNGLVFDTSSDYKPDLVKADYQQGKVAMIFSNSDGINFVQDVVAGTITSQAQNYYLPPTDPNQTYGGRVSFWYENLAVDHGIAVVKKLKDVAKLVGYEVDHTYSKWVDCYLSGTSTTSVNYNYNLIPNAFSKEIFLTSANKICYVDNLATGKIAVVNSGASSANLYDTGLTNMVMCRYKDGFFYGVRKVTASNGNVTYYLFHETFNNVIGGVYTQRKIDLPQSFEIKDIYLETTRN